MTQKGQIRHAIGISLDGALIQKIDKQRGMVPRSRYIDHILSTALREDENE